MALKVLLPELAAAIGPERFLQEIGIAARLQHPHIIPLYDSEEAQGCPYYVMPFVEGESLRDRLAKEGRLPLDEAVRVAPHAVCLLFASSCSRNSRRRIFSTPLLGNSLRNSMAVGIL
ncbi:MAG: hypothetical protein HYV20_12915 [Gemmatimonadetes bacterium]|nr:hypothetical protein [Gemmatimonadota bacterium]